MIQSNLCLLMHGNGDKAVFKSYMVKSLISKVTRKKSIKKKYCASKVAITEHTKNHDSTINAKHNKKYIY
jgi:hypothetical protein